MTGYLWRCLMVVQRTPAAPSAETTSPKAARGRAAPGERTGGQGRGVAGAAMPAVVLLLWGSAFIAGAIGVDAAPPLLLIFARFAAAGILLAGYAITVRAPGPRGRALAHLAVSGLLIQAVQFGALYCAMAMGLPAGIVAL